MNWKIGLSVATLIAFAVVAPHAAVAKSYSGKKVLLIDSYHEGYGWSDGIVEGVRSVVQPSGAELRIVRMDTKRNKTEEFKQAAALKVKGVIEEFKPDVVIAADDNATKYVVQPFYKDNALPFVFCGINWDATVYGYPYSNTTGMVEVSAVDELFELLHKLTRGKRVGQISADVFTSRKEAGQISKTFNITYAESHFVKTFAEWKEKFLELQGKVDIVLVGNKAGMADWNEEEAIRLAEQNSRIPTGAVHPDMTKVSLIAYTKLPSEQGEWAARTALRILDGTPPANIPITRNREGRLVINARIAQNVGATIPADLIESADEIIE